MGMGMGMCTCMDMDMGMGMDMGHGHGTWTRTWDMGMDVVAQLPDVSLRVSCSQLIGEATLSTSQKTVSYDIFKRVMSANR